VLQNFPSQGLPKYTQRGIFGLKNIHNIWQPCFQVNLCRCNIFSFFCWSLQQWNRVLESTYFQHEFEFGCFKEKIRLGQKSSSETFPNLTKNEKWNVLFLNPWVYLDCFSKMRF
jgi:hypothetical protein